MTNHHRSRPLGSFLPELLHRSPTQQPEPVSGFNLARIGLSIADLRGTIDMRLEILNERDSVNSSFGHGRRNCRQNFAAK
jgi:hypothetical protein